jgi:ribose/xylose/arabinose/galactoside ABC-type transport system permease subunit
MRRALRVPWVPLLVASVVAGIILALTTREFSSSFNIYTILQIAAVDAVVGLSQMIVLAIGDMSLAVGGMAGLVTVVVGYLYQVQHWPVGLAVLAGLVAGPVFGLINGLIIARSGLSAFIVTLATGTAFTGIAYGVTSALPYADVPSVLVRLGQGRASFFPYLLIVALLAAVRACAPGNGREQGGGCPFRSFTSAVDHHRTHPFRPACRGGSRDVHRSARECDASYRHRLAHHLLCCTNHRGHGANWW